MWSRVLTIEEAGSAGDEDRALEDDEITLEELRLLITDRFHSVGEPETGIP